jgi:hypothetical protein
MPTDAVQDELATVVLKCFLHVRRKGARLSTTDAEHADAPHRRHRRGRRRPAILSTNRPTTRLPQCRVARDDGSFEIAFLIASLASPGVCISLPRSDLNQHGPAVSALARVVHNQTHVERMHRFTDISL